MLTQNEQLLDRKPFYFRGFNSIGLCSRHYYFEFPGFGSLQSPEIRSLDLLTYRVIGTRERERRGEMKGELYIWSKIQTREWGARAEKGLASPIIYVSKSGR